MQTCVHVLASQAMPKGRGRAWISDSGRAAHPPAFFPRKVPVCVCVCVYMVYVSVCMLYP